MCMQKKRFPQPLKTILVCFCILLSFTFGHGHKWVTAHSNLVATQPAQGEILTETPSEIRLQFDNKIGAGSTVILFAENFQQIAAEAQIDPQTERDLVMPIEETLPNGVYTVQWLVISSDGHQLSGSYRFQMIGENKMEIVAEGTAVNLPGWFAWLMIILALGTPAAVWMWAKNSK